MMSNQYELSAQVRQDIGQGASRRLRLDNKIPAIMYGGAEKPVPLVFSHFEITKAFENEAFYSHIIVINIDGKHQKAVIKDIHRHAFKPKILHMDFLRINESEKIVMNVPLHFTGESKDIPGIKQGGILTHLLNSVEVRCLPKDLPEFIEVNVSQMVLDQIIHLSELNLPQGVELMAFTHGGDTASHDTGVVKIQLPRMIAAAEETPAAAAAVPAAKQAAPAAGDKKPEAKKAEAKKPEKK